MGFYGDELDFTSFFLVSSDFLVMNQILLGFQWVWSGISQILWDFTLINRDLFTKNGNNRNLFVTELWKRAHLVG